MGLPDSFILNFGDREQHGCRVRWRKLAEIGVEFDEADKLDPSGR